MICWMLFGRESIILLTRPQHWGIKGTSPYSPFCVTLDKAQKLDTLHLQLADGRRTVHPSILALPPLQAWVPQPHSLGTHPAQLELCQRQCGGPALTV